MFLLYLSETSELVGFQNIVIEIAILGAPRTTL